MLLMLRCLKIDHVALRTSEETPNDLANLDKALSADDAARATEAGRRLTIKEALDLARTPQTAAM